MNKVAKVFHRMDISRYFLQRCQEPILTMTTQSFIAFPVKEGFKLPGVMPFMNNQEE
jgi:hypothetical protein